MNQSTTYRTTWLVWLLAGIGLGTGVVTLAIVGAALWSVMAAKARQDGLHERLTSVVVQSQAAAKQSEADLRRLLADRPRYELTEYCQPPVLDRQAIETLRRADAGLAAALERMTAASAMIDGLYAECRQWAAQTEEERASQHNRRARLKERADADIRSMHVAAFGLREAELDLTRRQAAATGVTLQYAWRAVLLTAALAFGFFLGIAWKLPRAVTAQIEAIRHAAEEIEIARRKLKAQNIALEQTQKRAEAASHGKSEFLAMVSHEFRTPLTAVLGYSDILLARPLPADARDAMLAVQRNGQHLLSVVNDIMDLSKIEAGRLDVQLAPCSPLAVLREAADLMEPRCQARHITLALHLTGRFPSVIHADAVRLRQILINLLATAIELTEAGKVGLTARCTTGSAPQWIVELVAPGIGLTTAQMDRMFEPFANSAAAGGRGSGDMGLGLSISRRLATLLGGEIRVTSEIGRGTTLVLAVPLSLLEETPWIDPNLPPIVIEPRGMQPLESQPLPPVAALPEVIRATSREQPAVLRILVAEDGPDNQRLIATVLGRMGAEMEIVSNGAQAADLALKAWRSGCAFDVILMDMQMPVLDGYATARKLRDEGYDRPIIALTAHAMAHDRQKCLDAGCTDYSTKPLQIAELQAMIRRYAAVEQVT